jgi:glutamyl/glutaminyl-tRNA synthetase
VEQFRSAGYLPEAMNNFMSLLSWTDGTEQEIFTMEELIAKFSLERVSSSAAVFDFDKLKWMNGMYIRAAELDRIAALCKPYLLKAGIIAEDFDNERLTKIVASVRDNLEVLSDIVQYTEVYFKPFELANDEETKEILALPTTKAVLSLFLQKIDGQDWLSVDAYKEKVKEVQKEAGAKGKPLYMGIRVGLTGRTKGPELDQFVPLMPVSVLKERLKEVIGRL